MRDRLPSGVRLAFEVGTGFTDRCGLTQLNGVEMAGVRRGGVKWEPPAEVGLSKEPTLDQLISACSGVLPQEDLEDLPSMPLDEAMGYVFTLLSKAGVDPEEFLKGRGILE